MVEVDDIVAAVGEGMCGMRGTLCLGACAKNKVTKHYFFDVQCFQKILFSKNTNKNIIHVQKIKLLCPKPER